MQLLLRRSQKEGALGIKFDLWAKFEVTEEEQELLSKYRVHHAILSEGDPPHDLKRAAKYAAGLGLLVYLLAFIFLARGALLLGVLAFAAATYFIYQQMREEIRVSDILDGRTFACRSVVTLMQKEATVSEMAVVFRRFLEAMKTWGGAEVMTCAPELAPGLVRELASWRRSGCLGSV